MLEATRAISGATMRQGPHHGAQKSTTIGSGDAATSASKDAASGTSIGSPGAASAVPHLPQRVSADRLEYGSRFRWPHERHGTTMPF